MDFAETAEHAELRAAVGGIAAGSAAQYYASQPRAGRPCDELWAELGEAGFIGVNIPAEYGGGGGGITELAIVCEETAAQGCPLLLLLVSARSRPRCSPGSAPTEQRKAVAARARRRRQQGGLRHHRARRRVEHPPAGHHGPARRRRLGAERHQVLHLRGGRGRRRSWSWPRTGRDAATGTPQLSLFLVPTDAPGPDRARRCRSTPMLPEQAVHAALRRRAAAREALVGGEGAASGRSSTGSTRSGSPAPRSASASPGTCWARRPGTPRAGAVWDAPIGTHQGVAHPLAQAKIETELAALMTGKAAWQHDHGQPAGRGGQHGQVRRRRGRHRRGGRGHADPRRQRAGHRVRPGAATGAWPGCSGSPRSTGR